MPILENDISRFTEGDCLVLAKRLHRVGGLPLHTFMYADQYDLHAFVMHDGKPLDVMGLHDLDEFIADWSVGSSRAELSPPLEPKDVSFWALEFGKYSYARARIVAEILLDEYVR
jgi:hypothetical protein